MLKNIWYCVYWFTLLFIIMFIIICSLICSLLICLQYYFWFWNSLIFDYKDFDKKTVIKYQYNFNASCNTRVSTFTSAAAVREQKTLQLGNIYHWLIQIPQLLCHHYPSNERPRLKGDNYNKMVIINLINWAILH